MSTISLSYIYSWGIVEGYSKSIIKELDLIKLGLLSKLIELWNGSFSKSSNPKNKEYIVYLWKSFF